MRYVTTTVLLIAVCVPSVAHANGTTLMPGGAASVSRGGATAARPEDPMAMATNPAGLAFLPDSQVLLDADTPFQKMCDSPYGYYGWGISQPNGKDLSTGQPVLSEFGDQLKAPYANSHLDTVCNSAPTFPIPQIAWAGRISKHFALGAGLLAPVLVPGQQWGGADGTINSPNGPRPTPTRYAGIKQEAIYASAPTFAAAYRVIPQLSFGLSLQIISIALRSIQVQNAIGSTRPTDDFLGTLTVQDFFIPALTFGVHARPVRPVNLMAAFKWSDDFRGSGDVVYETNTYFRGPGLVNAPYKNAPIKLGEIDVPLPWELDLGARFSGMLPGAKEEGDPMSTERWDVEVDFDYYLTRRTSESNARLGAKGSLTTQTASGQRSDAAIQLDPSQVGAVSVDSHVKDSYAVRVGGSYSVLPKRFAVNAGAFYENRGVDLAFADITSFDFQRVGMSIGMMFRFGSWDLRAGATHIISETVEIAPPPHQNLDRNGNGFDQRIGGTFNDQGIRTGGTLAKDPAAPAPGKADAVAAKREGTGGTSSLDPNRIVNAGRYSAWFDVLSVGVAYHF